MITRLITKKEATELAKQAGRILPKIHGLNTPISENNFICKVRVDQGIIKSRFAIRVF